MTRKMITIKCKWCGKNVSGHFSPKQEYCSSQCFANSRNKKVIHHCLVCNKEFEYKPSPSGNAKGSGKYCSKKCKGIASRNSQIACKICGIMFYPGITKRTTCSTACKHESRKTGKMVKCTYCGKSFYLPKARINNGHNNFFCSLDHQIAWQGRNKLEYKCKTCGKVFRMSASHKRVYCSSKCQNEDPEMIQHLRNQNLAIQKLKPNNVEKSGYHILEDIGVYFEPQKLIANKFLVDAFLPIQNIIIQFDGDYWHGHPIKFPNPDNRQQKRMRLDKSQDAYFAKCGYIVLRFWEGDIKNRPNWVLDEIKSKIK